MDQYDIIIILTLIGFLVVATLLLFPVYRFLIRQEEISKEWTQEKIAERQAKDSRATNGKPEGAAKLD